jgi:hypothetical protein
MPATQQQKVDLASLEKRIGELQKNLAFVGQGSNPDSSQLFKIIHKPGWTTVQQVALATQILDAMNHQALAMQGLQKTLQTHVEESGAQ